MKAISLLLATAQRASDCGKWYKLPQQEQIASEELGKLLPLEINQHCIVNGYTVKDACIRRAVEMIRRDRRSAFHFRVTPSDVQGPRCLIYFDFKIGGKRYQVSFHSFDYRLAQMIERTPTGHWNRKSSRQACMELLRSL